MTTIAKFVNREVQKEMVEKLLDAVENSAAGGPETNAVHRILETYGLAGVGKSRMLDEVKAASRERGLPFVVLDFLPYAYGELEAPLAHILLAICSQFDHYFQGMASVRSYLLPLVRQTPKRSNGEQNPKNKLEQELSENLAAIRSELATVLMQEQKPFVVLLDSTEYCPDALFDMIGRDLVGKIIEEYPQLSLAVFAAGRSARVLDSSWPGWLKDKQKTEQIRLDPLDLAFTEEHIGNLPPEGRYKKAAREIYAVSNGHAYSTESLVEWLNLYNIDVSQVGQRKQDLAHRLHDEVITRYVLAKAGDWVLNFVVTASVLRRFDASMLRQLMDDQHSVTWYIQRLADLQDQSLHLVEFGDTEPAYYLEPTLAKLLRTIQAILHPEATIALHQSAKTIWEGELANRVSARFALEAVYHAAQIATIGGTDACIAAKNTLDQLLVAYFKPVEHEQALSELRDFIAKDHDLEVLVRKECVDDLASRVVKHVRIRKSGAVPFEFTHLIIDHRPPNEYTVTWYAMDQVLLPTEVIRSPRQFPPEKWRNEPEAVGKAAFATYLPRRAQEFVRSRRDWAIQITTDWVDIPWELLHDGEDFLCLSRPIARKPKMLKEPASSTVRWTNRALVVGNPTGDLPGAEAEARAIAKLLRKQGMEVRLLVGSQEATATEFQICLTNDSYDLIHYAGHGEHNVDAPHLSALQFPDGPYYAEELERALQGAPFVFLSACETGQAQTSLSSSGYRGRFVEGLAAAALVGGASGCLGPIWEIGDGVAREFALAFYGELLGGQPIGEAVREARLATRNLSTDFWAAWILYGDPFRKLIPSANNLSSSPESKS